MKEINQGLRRHLLLTAPIRKQLIKAHDKGADPTHTAYVKFFSPYNGWTWWATEFDGDDTFYGLVNGWELEYGSFSYRELQETTLVTVGYTVPAIERDCSWTPQPITEVYEMARFDRRGR